MNYNDYIDYLVESVLNERIHHVRSQRFPAFPESERLVARGDRYMDPDVEASGSQVGERLGRELGDPAHHTFLYRPAALPAENKVVRDIQGTKHIDTQPAHIQWALDPGHRVSDETGVEIAGPALYTSPHAAVHAGGKVRGIHRPVFVLHAKDGGEKLTLGGHRSEYELSDAISQNLAKLAMDRVVTARDRTVERRHSQISPERYLKVKERPKGGLELAEPDELAKVAGDIDPKISDALGTIHKDWLAREAGMWLSDRFRRQGVSSITTFPKSLGGKAARIVFPHQERLRSYWGHHDSGFITKDTDWSKLTGK